MADIRGEEKIYPASVVKMFYMTALFQQIENGKVKMTPELERGLKEMIGVSSNDATHYIFDVITDTSGGAELSEKELEKILLQKKCRQSLFRVARLSKYQRQSKNLLRRHFRARTAILGRRQTAQQIDDQRDRQTFGKYRARQSRLKGKK